MSYRKTIRVGDTVEIVAPGSCYDGRRARVVALQTSGRPVVDEASASAAGLGVLWGNAFFPDRLKRVRPAKSNDASPPDEMLLAEAIAEAKARGLKWCAGAPFKGPGYSHMGGSLLPTKTKVATACCAIGAAALARPTARDAYAIAEVVFGPKYLHVYEGNDYEQEGDDLHTWGRAFRDAMTD